MQARVQFPQTHPMRSSRVRTVSRNHATQPSTDAKNSARGFKSPFAAARIYASGLDVNVTFLIVWPETMAQRLQSIIRLQIPLTVCILGHGVLVVTFTDYPCDLKIIRIRRKQIVSVFH